MGGDPVGFRHDQRSAQTLNEWVKKTGSGTRAGFPTNVVEKLKAIERENRELRQVNERSNLTTGSTAFRKAYLQSIIDVVEVDDAQICIKGSTHVLEQAVLASRTCTTGVRR